MKSPIVINTSGEADNSKQDEKDLRETPLKVLWKKNGKVYNAKKLRGSFEPYLGPVEKPSRTDRSRQQV